MFPFRRVLFVVTFALWQGGFLFYAGVVVPVGTRVLESSTEQGFITRAVTPWLNVCGLLALACWLWVLLGERPSGKPLKPPLMLWGVLLASVLFLVGWHGRMDQFLDAATHSVIDPERFYAGHRIYLIVSAAQWLVSMLLLVMTLRLWAAHLNNGASTE